MTASNLSVEQNIYGTPVYVDVSCDQLWRAWMFVGVISTPEGTDDESLSKLFMRIDSNCDAKVDW